jgi:DNA-binding CsgD family transcriptional regulator
MEFRHDYLGAHPSRYRLVDPETIRLLTPDVVKTIRYFQGKVLPRMLSRTLPRISAYRISKVLNNKTFPEITVPKGYRPPKHLVEKLEDISSRRSRYRVYLGPIALRTALHDISRSRLTLREKRILRKYAQQIPVDEIRRKEGVSRARIYKIIETSLGNIYKEYGDKRWFFLLSKTSRR